MTSESDELQAAAGVRTLIHMDDPQHRVVRAIAFSRNTLLSRSPPGALDAPSSLVAPGLLDGAL